MAVDLMTWLRQVAAQVAHLWKYAAMKTDVPTYAWATVATVGPPATVILEHDESGSPRAVSANSVGYLEVGWRVRVERVQNKLTIVAAPAAITAITSRVAALESPGPWVTCTLSGVTGNAIVRKLSNNLAEITASVVGTFAEGNTSNIITLPVGYRPVNPTGTSHVRLPGYFNGGYVATVWVEPGGAVGVTQRSGGTRSDLAFRGVFGLN